jgi:putative hydrolase of the HAD superfamily
MIEAVLFDYGMVLSGPADPVWWAEMQRITGLDEDRFQAAYWAPRHAYDRGTHTGQEYWLEAGKHAGVALDEGQVGALIAADTALWTTLNVPMVEWAGRLQAAGTRTGILSNLGDEMTAGVLRKLPWLEAFDAKVFSHALKLAKPELEIYRHAADELDMVAEQILFVDDREENCEAARATGMHVIRYLEHAEFVREMERRGLRRLWQEGRMKVEK